MIRVQSEPVYIGRAKMEHAGLMVIDPYDGVIVMLAHGVTPFRRLIIACCAGHEV
jgi:hypothetical protein